MLEFELIRAFKADRVTHWHYVRIAWRGEYIIL